MTGEELIREVLEASYLLDCETKDLLIRETICDRGRVPNSDCSYILKAQPICTKDIKKKIGDKVLYTLAIKCISAEE